MIDKMQRRQLWKDRIEAWQASGVSAAAWCREHNLPYITFLNWRRRFRVHKEKPSFAELPLDITSETGVEIHVGRLCIKLAPAFDPETLTRALRVLGNL